MFSTLEGAKKFAKNLKSLFDDSGIIFPLNRCQKAAAIAGGSRDWHDLSRSLAGSDRPVDPGAFRRRLIAFLPQPCWIPYCFGWMRGNWRQLTAKDSRTITTAPSCPMCSRRLSFTEASPPCFVPAPVRDSGCGNRWSSLSLAWRKRQQEIDPAARAGQLSARRFR